MAPREAHEDPAAYQPEVKRRGPPPQNPEEFRQFVEAQNFERDVIGHLDRYGFRAYRRIVERSQVPGTYAEHVRIIFDLVQILKNHPDLILRYNVFISQELGVLSLHPTHTFLLTTIRGETYSLGGDRPVRVL